MPATTIQFTLLEWCVRVCECLRVYVCVRACVCVQLFFKREGGGGSFEQVLGVFILLFSFRKLHSARMPANLWPAAKSHLRRLQLPTPPPPPPVSARPRPALNSTLLSSKLLHTGTWSCDGIWVTGKRGGGGGGGGKGRLGG